jgi:xylulose-5-phosphate/fructose-6-phosphate phosphoketolase
MSDPEYDALITKDKPIIFAFHGYPWLIHRLTYRRANQRLHVRGYKEEGTITTAFDMTVRNDMDRFHLVMDAIKRTGLTSDEALKLKNLMETKLIEHNAYIVEHGIDMPEVLNWNWDEATKK